MLLLHQGVLGSSRCLRRCCCCICCRDQNTRVLQVPVACCAGLLLWAECCCSGRLHEPVPIQRGWVIQDVWRGRVKQTASKGGGKGVTKNWQECDAAPGLCALLASYRGATHRMLLMPAAPQAPSSCPNTCDTVSNTHSADPCTPARVPSPARPLLRPHL